MRKYLRALLCGVLCGCLLVLVGCGARQYTGLWQAYDQAGRVCAQLEIAEPDAAMYLYVLDEDSFTGNDLLLNSMSIQLTDNEENGVAFRVSEHDFYGLEEVSGTIMGNGDLLTVKWLNNGSVLEILPIDILPIETLPTDFHHVPDAEAAAGRAARPFFATDIEFPFAADISPQDFIETYGQPNEMVTQDFLIGTEEVALTYDDFEVVWLHWQDSGLYSLSRFDSRSEVFCHKVRNVSLGDTLDDVINNFMHDDTISQTAYRNLKLLYGEAETMYNFGSIEGDKLFYAHGDKVLTFEFVDDRLDCIRYRVLW